jgi:hypothetical protein
MLRNDELLFLETDGACAFCGHKDTRALTIHHIIRAVPKIEDYDNKIVLCHNCHQCHHQGKGPTSDEIKQIKRRLIIKTLTPLGVNALKYAYRRSRVSAAPFQDGDLPRLGNVYTMAIHRSFPCEAHYVRTIRFEMG